MGRAVVETVSRKWSAVRFRALLCQGRDGRMRSPRRSRVEHWIFALDIISDKW
jgi:hypothetical protein